MTWAPASTRKDDVQDASEFLLRLGYSVIAVAAPVGVVLHPLAIFILFPIGVALIALAAFLDPPGGVGRHFGSGLSSPVILLCLGGFAWAALSLVWTPFFVEAGQHTLKIIAWIVGVSAALMLTREHARATDLYLFPIGLAALMTAIFVAWVAQRHGAPIEDSRITEGGAALTTLIFPAMGGLAARGRNGYARLLLLLGFVFVFAIGSAPNMVALFVGFAALSFAVSDLKRTARDLSYLSAAAIALAPLWLSIAEPLLRLMMNQKLPALPAPFPSIAFAFGLVKQDWLRLILGHGFETVSRGIKIGALPSLTPRALVFQLWYEFGVIGAFVGAGAAAFGFRAIGGAPARLAPYLAAALACNLTLGFLSEDLGDPTWFTVLAIAIISSDIAARSQYRTTRPSAEGLAHF